jgi:AcrR family transcriptional regulator
MTEHQTQERILLAALTLFFEQGIKKTSLAEIAYRAGVTRVTVYRYFEDKRELARQTFLRIEHVFQESLTELQKNPEAGLETCLQEIGKRLSALPTGDISACFEELKRLYPDVYTSVQETRRAALNGIFDHLFTLADRQGLLRPGLNKQLVQAVFWELVINFFDNPRLESFGLSNDELYHSVSQILLYGILRDAKGSDEGGV